jgi:Mrp family chromosome partitioning ATPase
MEDIRREFRYSIIHGPPAIEAGEALSLAQWGDGLILVVSAQHSKRLTAMRVREMLAETDVRLLGIVLTDREFPIPEKIYRLL